MPSRIFNNNDIYITDHFTMVKEDNIDIYLRCLEKISSINLTINLNKFHKKTIMETE